MTKREQKVNRSVTWGEGKLPVLRFKKDRKCPDCKKKYILNKEWGEWCWYCGHILKKKGVK